MSATTTRRYVKIVKSRAGSIASLHTIHRVECKRISVLAVRIEVSHSDLSGLNSHSFCGICMKDEKALADKGAVNVADPARKFADGDVVTFPVAKPGSRTEVVTVAAQVVGAILVGVRHPGYIYELQLADGSTRHLPTGLLTAAD